MTKHIVLIGGGHAHVEVMRHFRATSPPGIRMTLIARDLLTPYSGMLPGVVAGHYRASDAHIDLTHLAANTGVALLHGEACGIDGARKAVTLRDGREIAYDFLSLDVGITPALAAIDGAREYAIAVKPIGAFLEKFERLRSACREKNGPRSIAVIGGGAGGVELLLSLRHRLLNEAQDRDAFRFMLVTEAEILATHNVHVRDAFRRVFARQEIELIENMRVAAVGEGTMTLAGGEVRAADAVLVTTNAAAPDWFADTHLVRDAGGFIAVNDCLQSRNDPDVFAAGDCASLPSPREKSGVYAVRAGPPLARNLFSRALGKDIRPWHPQRRHLALISTGNRYAIASRGVFKAEGGWWWRLKEWIDRRWMAKYR